MLRFEREYWDSGLARVAGVDEAGRGPLAGPVVAAAVVLDSAFALDEEQGLFDGMTDSKKLREPRREAFYLLLEQSPSVDIGVGSAEIDEIDRLNILRATHLAMARALDALEPAPDHALVDGRPVKGLPCSSTAIVGGDGRSLSIAAASIVAKVLRDRMMRELDVLYPHYGFSRNKGYGSRAHIQALLEHGPSPVHRRSFRPVRESEEIRDRADGAEDTDRQGRLF